MGRGGARGDFVRVGGGRGVWVLGWVWVAGGREVLGQEQVCVCLGPSLPTACPGGRPEGWTVVGRSGHARASVIPREIMQVGARRVRLLLFRRPACSLRRQRPSCWRVRKRSPEPYPKLGSGDSACEAVHVREADPVLRLLNMLQSQHSHAVQCCRPCGKHRAPPRASSGPESAARRADTTCAAERP